MEFVEAMMYYPMIYFEQPYLFTSTIFSLNTQWNIVMSIKNWRKNTWIYSNILKYTVIKVWFVISSFVMIIFENSIFFNDSQFLKERLGSSIVNLGRVQVYMNCKCEYWEKLWFGKIISGYSTWLKMTQC